ncbi:MAG: aspartate ammonia-lyase [Fimbriimonadales bacterium]
MSTRIERDSLGDVNVPENAYWGSQAERSRQLFQISGLTEHPKMIDAYVLLKKACAKANGELGLITQEQANAIVEASDEILSGKNRDQFPVDVFHMGAGTSFNMNTNEVLANRAEEILGGKKGDYKLVNPNDHVNYGQSTNDTFPTAMRLMSRMLLQPLLQQVDLLAEALEKKGNEFDHVLKSGRTHLQDAVPIRLGQEFTAYGAAIRRTKKMLDLAANELEELGIGGSAAGTGMNTHPKYRFRVVELLAQETGLPFRTTDNMVEAMQSQLCMGALSAAVRVFCLELTRITNDLRLLCSGPLTGIAEIVLPPVQPGSSIMPGKVNPSMAENMNIVLFQVMGQCHSIDMCVQAGQLELNVMMPGMVFSAQFMLQVLSNTLDTFRKNCIEGITANEDICRKYAEVSPSLATALNVYLGYKQAAEVVKTALKEHKTIPQVVRELNLLDEETLTKALDPAKLTEPGIPGKDL